MASVVGSSYVSKELIAILVFFLERYFNMSLLLKRAGFFYARIESFLNNIYFLHYQKNKMVKQAVERELEII